MATSSGNKAKLNLVRKDPPAEGKLVAVTAGAAQGPKASRYHLRISRLTVDKLGVKLYDKASAVVAELIANGYDADAEKVVVRIPLNVQLASKAGGVDFR